MTGAPLPELGEVERAEDFFEALGVSYDRRVVSAHRTQILRLFGKARDGAGGDDPLPRGGGDARHAAGRAAGRPRRSGGGGGPPPRARGRGRWWCCAAGLDRAQGTRRTGSATLRTMRIILNIVSAGILLLVPVSPARPMPARRPTRPWRPASTRRPGPPRGARQGLHRRRDAGRAGPGSRSSSPTPPPGGRPPAPSTGCRGAAPGGPRRSRWGSCATSTCASWWAGPSCAPRRRLPATPVQGSGPPTPPSPPAGASSRLAEPAIDLAVSVAVTVAHRHPGRRRTPGDGRRGLEPGRLVCRLRRLGPVHLRCSSWASAPRWPRSASNDVGLLVCNVAVGYQALPWLQPELELNYQHEIETGEQRDEQVLWATAALVLPLDPVRVVVGARFPVLVLDTSAGPMATAAVKLAF